MNLAEVIHHLVDNSNAFDQKTTVEAHQAVSEAFGETERHFMVPSPEAQKAADDEKAARVAQLRAELAALEPEPEPEPAPAG